ncbi:MAG: C39 family peptidase [Oscillospiraceae bacterium]|jgi:predicted double-glycine peptidase|nr:C39 family peptidase [Oscillospiraceae bacterium]
MFKKIISATLTVCLCVALATTVAASQQVTTVPPPIDDTDYSLVRPEWDLGRTSVGGQEATAEDMAKSVLHNKSNSAKAAAAYYDAELSVSDAGIWEALSPFYYYAQELDYSCGAASVRMAMRYLTGSAYSESVIRSGCNTTSTNGTTIVNMKTYINSIQSQNAYYDKYGASKSTMKDDLYAGIVTYGAPPIIGLKEVLSNGWPYNLSAHITVIHSVASDKSSVYICDPWTGYIVGSGNTYTTYSKTTDTLYTAYSLINIGYMF